MPVNPNTPPSLISRMLQRDFYPHATADSIALIQTHISHVFLTGPFAYKVKKAVNLGFADFSTLQRRQHFCAEEVRLNQRGAPDIYLGVVAIVERQGELQLGGDGHVVEYAVKMRQFPQEQLLRNLLACRRLPASLIDTLAKTIATFHQTAPTNPAIAGFGHWPRVRQVIEENYRYTERFIGGPQSHEQFQQTKEFTDRFFSESSQLLDSRVSGGCIRECHGDLHLGNICFWEGKLLLFDCIEFNESFRFVDVMQDAAFTAMDLRASGREDLSWLFINTYAERTADWEGIQLLPLYLCRHAYVRAKVNSLSMDEPGLSAKEREATFQSAAAYYRLAWEYGRPRQGRLILVSGLSGSGKSTVARELAMRIGAMHVRADAIRKHLAAVPLDKHGGDALYTQEMNDRTLARLLDIGTRLARSGFSVILDTKFDRRIKRLEALRSAAALALPVHVLQCVAPLDVMRERLASRSGDISDATPAILDRQVGQFEPFDESTEARPTVLDTTQPLDLNGLANSILHP